MIIKPDGTVRFLTVNGHLQRKTLAYQDNEYTVSLHPHQDNPFGMGKGRGKDVYIDLFALHFGQKEQARRRIAKGWASIRYGCSRAERDTIFMLPLEELIELRTCRQCQVQTCQYWSKPTGVKGPYAFNCILVRYRTLGIIDHKGGLTLEEVGRIYGCTRERIRQIQDHAMRRMRHHTRLKRMQVFRARTHDYRDYGVRQCLEVA